jgi:hypothetical protein
VISVDTIDTATPGDRWPPTAADEQRLEDYATYLKLFLGRHAEVFDPYRRPDQGPYVTTNVLGAISRLTAHRLFGEAPKARVRAGSESAVHTAQLTAAAENGDLSARELRSLVRQQELLDFLCQSNAWQQLCYAGALGGSYRGDSVFKVRYDARQDAVLIEDVSPSLLFPHVDVEAPDTVRAESLAWTITSVSGPGSQVSSFAASREPETRDMRHETGVAWLREEYHEPGLIENRLWKLVAVPGEDRYYRRRVDLSALEETAELPEVVETGLDVIPIVHIPNRRVAETGIWGQSDYTDLVSLQEALNRRRTQTSSILDKHADPLLAIDESFLDEQGRLPMDRIRAIPLVQDEPPPQYVTWDGKLSDSRAEADELTQMILLVAGISPESFGFGQGGGPESGFAIRLRQMLTTSTVAGKRLQWEPGLRKLLSVATGMFVTHVQDKSRHGLSGVGALEPEQIGIEFGDGLPPDLSASIQDEVSLQGAGLASKEASLRRLFPDWSEAEIEAEVERLAASDAPSGAGPPN